jgi:hypothetical protein
MKTNIGANVKRKRDDPDKRLPMKCYSCAIQSGGGWSGKKVITFEGKCNGFVQAVADDMRIVECDKYVEQIFSMKKTTKRAFRKNLQEYLWESVEGRGSITQQSDNWYAMEIELYAGLLALLQHREGFNKLQEVGRRFLARHHNSIEAIEEEMEEVDEIPGDQQ